MIKNVFKNVLLAISNSNESITDVKFGEPSVRSMSVTYNGITHSLNAYTFNNTLCIDNITEIVNDEDYWKEIATLYDTQYQIYKDKYLDKMLQSLQISKDNYNCPTIDSVKFLINESKKIIDNNIYLNEDCYITINESEYCFCINGQKHLHTTESDFNDIMEVVKSRKKTLEDETNSKNKEFFFAFA